jgi:hypothetical protein
VKRLTLVLLVDALRHDYAERMPFLTALGARSSVGTLREDFGFLPRAAYFGGRTPSQHGFTNMFSFDPARSPFGVARGLPVSRWGRDVEDAFDIRKWVEAEAKKRVPPFAATYLSTIEIPLDLLPDFNLAEERAPWDPRVGYPSIFAELAAHDWPWFACGWPESNTLPDHSDRGLVDHTLAHVRPPCRFAFLHLQELDGLGHAYGPESVEVQEGLARTDALVCELLAELDRRFDAVDVVLFGDHGMVSVTGTTDVWAALEAAPIQLGQDVVFFLDSSMARFWFKTAAARQHVIDALAPLPGRVLDAAAMDALDLSGCDPRNGELYFLAHPGILILPNFFQRRGRPVKGMHGYHPDCPDNQAFFLLRRAGDSSASDLGTVRPTAVYDYARASLGLTRPASRRVARVTESQSRFTLNPDPRAHAMVDRHLAEIVDAARAAVPALEAVVLTGSFGRGEGGVMASEDGVLRPVNDYDVLLVAPGAMTADLGAIGKSLASRFELDFVHFGHWTRVDPALPLTLAHFDIREGHQVLWGPSDALVTLPKYAAIDLPPIESVQLLMNRMAGLLTGLRGPFTAPAPLGPDEHRYLRTQTMKALMALGDAALMAHGAYACSYRRRLERLTWLAPGLRMDADQLGAIQDAYAFKLHPSAAPPADLVALAGRTSEWLLDAFTAATRRIVPQHVTDAPSAARAYYDLMTSNAGAISADNMWCLDALARGAVAARPQPTASIRQSIYTALPLLLAASHGDDTAFDEALVRLDDCFTPPWPAGLTADNWDAARRRTADAWLTLVH